MEFNAYAKINWDLLILGKREDGFHALDSVMVNVGLHDTLTFERAETISMTCSDPSLPTDDGNLVVKAAKALALASGRNVGARIHLEKRIPAGGGMGGGSSDAATTLRGLNKLWDLNWPAERLAPIAASLGSDIAFFLYGGWRRCLGRGEIVQPIEGAELWAPIPLLLVLPPLHVSTPAVYKSLNAPKWDGKTESRSLTQLVQAINSLQSSMSEGGAHGRPSFQNDLTPAARRVEPRLEPVQQVLESQYPGRWLMSGSGAVHFAVPYSSRDDGSALTDALRTSVGPGIRVLTSTTFTPLL